MPIPPPPPSHAAPAPPVMPQSLRLREFPSDSNREQPLPCFQFLPPIKEASSPLAVQSFSSSNINLRRSPAIRRSPSPEIISSLHISPAESSTNNTNTGASAPSPSSYFNLHRTWSPGPDLSDALGSEDEFYVPVEDTMSGGQYHGLPATDIDASSASFYYNSPVQRPVKPLVPLHPTGTAAFYAGPVRGAVRADTQWGDPF